MILFNLKRFSIHILIDLMITITIIFHLIDLEDFNCDHPITTSVWFDGSIINTTVFSNSTFSQIYKTQWNCSKDAVVLNHTYFEICDNVNFKCKWYLSRSVHTSFLLTTVSIRVILLPLQGLSWKRSDAVCCCIITTGKVLSMIFSFVVIGVMWDFSFVLINSGPCQQHSNSIEKKYLYMIVLFPVVLIDIIVPPIIIQDIQDDQIIPIELTDYKKMNERELRRLGLKINLETMSPFLNYEEYFALLREFDVRSFDDTMKTISERKLSETEIKQLLTLDVEEQYIWDLVFWYFQGVLYFVAFIVGLFYTSPLGFSITVLILAIILFMRDIYKQIMIKSIRIRKINRILTDY